MLNLFVIVKYLNGVLCVTTQEEEKRGDDSDMVDLSSLTDDQLKRKLLQYGVKAGPIVGQYFLMS